MPDSLDGHALIIGIADYNQIKKLPGTVLKDARDVCDTLVDPAICAYPKNQVQLLLNEKATLEGIRGALANLAARSSDDAVVFIYISGHGGRVEKGPDIGEYLLPVNVQLKLSGASIELAAETAISGAEFTRAVRAIKARKLVVVFDCCHSGGIGQPKEAAAPVFKSGLPDSYYQELASGRGRVILSSSRDSEESWILPGAENSLFTQHLLAGMRGGVTSNDGLIRIFDLFEYLQPRVTAAKPIQHPVFKSDLEENFPIALYLGGQRGNTTMTEPESTSHRVGGQPAGYLEGKWGPEDEAWEAEQTETRKKHLQSLLKEYQGRLAFAQTTKAKLGPGDSTRITWENEEKDCRSKIREFEQELRGMKLHRSGTNAAPSNRRADFVLVTALAEERDAVLGLLSEHRKLPPSEQDIRIYFQADLPVVFNNKVKGTYHVIVMPLLGMGRVQATAATVDAIRCWRPRYIILVGIAGGVAARDVEVGDILISDQIVDYELQKITPQGPQVRWDVQRADPRLLNASNNLLSNAWQEAIQTKRPISGVSKRHVGPIASGDKVIAFSEILEKYSQTWPKLIGVEMEAAGVATAAFQSSESPGFFMVRCASDLADKNKDTSDTAKWRAYSCDAAAAYAIALLRSGPVPMSEGNAENQRRR